MMDNLREAANHTVFKIILVVIAIAFTLSGVGGYLISGTNDYAVKVNGQKISRINYDNALSNRRSQLQQQYGDNYSQVIANENTMQIIRQQVLQQLIDQTLLEQYVRKLSLDISDEQIKQVIFQNPAFQSDNKFDNARYKAAINNMRLTPEQYAEYLREQLTSQQLISALSDTNFILSTETDNLATLLAQKRVVREAAIQVKSLVEKQQVTEPEITAYYQNNQAQFTEPEQFRVDYIEMDATDINPTVSKTEIQDYYQQHKNEFVSPQQVRYSVIQTKTEQQAQQVLDALHKGADFAALAKKESADIISAKKGGDIGWLTSETTPQELKDIGLTEKGQISGVTKSSDNFLVARLDDIKPAETKPLSEVQQAIADKLKHDKSLMQWYALQQKVSDSASNDNSSLNEAAHQAGVKVQQTGWITSDDVPAALDFQPVKTAIFDGNLLNDSGKPTGNSDIITTDGDRAFVVRIADYKPKAITPLKQVHDQVVTVLKQQKAENEAQQQANKLLEQLKAGKGDAALNAAGLSFGAPQTFERNETDALAKVAFSLVPPAKDKSSYGIGRDNQGNVVLLALDAVQQGNMNEQQKASLAQIIKQNYTGMSLNALIASLRGEAKIKTGHGMEQ